MTKEEPTDNNNTIYLNSPKEALKALIEAGVPKKLAKKYLELLMFADSYDDILVKTNMAIYRAVNGFSLTAEIFNKEAFMAKIVSGTDRSTLEGLKKHVAASGNEELQNALDAVLSATPLTPTKETTSH